MKISFKKRLTFWGQGAAAKAILETPFNRSLPEDVQFGHSAEAVFERAEYWKAFKKHQDRMSVARCCPYTRNSKEANWWWRGFSGKKAPVNPLVYMTKNMPEIMPGAGRI